MNQGPVSELALCSLYGTRQLPALSNANDPVLTADVDFVYGVDGGTDVEWVKGHGMQQLLLFGATFPLQRLQESNHRRVHLTRHAPAGSNDRNPAA